MVSNMTRLMYGIRAPLQGFDVCWESFLGFHPRLVLSAPLGLGKGT
ncbi:hypothetical protein Cflav_PD6351 [Pedosphaera parvula Ellin514]|uniref:Uncharacterized protein n=1 Tax=Pedosphaera parvula (strain Ellin514) TaxID=320771 RepID=B9XDD0_PEDPL|nr:hypothetical protein Cflav_PD6351 [Pedosphaera parvula Ellin514]